jgi:poly-gamma-glutamate system protein
MIIPKKISNWTMIVICLFAVLVMVLAHNAPRRDKWYLYKEGAARAMYEAEMAVAQRAEKTGIREKDTLPTDRFKIEGDRYNAVIHLIGGEISPLVSSKGSLYSKIACADPNFAAVIVQLFREAGVKEGDTVAAAFSGSMPGADIAILSAAKVMGLNPIIISSLGASGWGATDPELTWLDIERILYEEGVFAFRSVAASMGGYWDIQKKKSRREKEMIAGIIKRNGVSMIYEEDVAKNTARRMQIYKEHAGARPIKAFVNVGGDSAVVGSKEYRKYIPSGLFYDLPLDKFPRKGVIMYMVQDGVPVINIKNIRRFVQEYDLDPLSEKFPDIGRGNVYQDSGYVVSASGAALFVLLTFSMILIWADVYFLPRVIGAAGFLRKK